MLLPVICFGQAAEAGSSLGFEALAKFGTIYGFNEYIIKPLMSGSTPMSTLDNSQQFNASLLCPNSQVLAQMLIQPGSTGDLNTLIISQDLNFDGSLDYTYSAPMPVSGICSNGIISCDPGTWFNCRAYRWTADEDSQVFLEETMNTNLGGCYCINTSCGSNLALSNVELVLKTLGGGATSAVRKVNTRYVVSGMDVEGMMATYYGQNAGQCQTVSIGGATNYESFFYNPATMESAANAEIASQSADPDSLYNIMDGILTNRSADIVPCTINRSSIMTWDSEGNCVVQDSIIDGCALVAEDPECTLKEEMIDGVTTVHNFMFTGLSPMESCIELTNTASASCNYGCPSEPDKPCFDSGAGVPLCTLSSGATETCTLITPIVAGGGGGSQGCGAYVAGQTLHVGCGAYLTFAEGIEVWGGGSVNAGAGLCFYGSGYAPGVDPATGRAYDSYIDIRSNPWYPQVGLIYFKGAVVSGSNSFFSSAYAGAVSIYVHGNYQGWDMATAANCCGGAEQNYIQFYHCPLPGGSACMGIPPYCSKTCSDIVCREWWHKERTYVCSNTAYDFSDIRNRADSIKSTTTDNTTSFYYRDYRKQDDGTWAYEDNLYDTSGVYRPTVSNCTAACKTITPKEGTDTTMVDVRTDFLVNPSMYDVHYRNCTAASCPLSVGEVILKDCQCIEEFMEAAIIMQILHMAGKDFICSSGTKQSMSIP